MFLGGEMSVPREHSEATAEQIDLAVRKIVDQCYKEAEEILKQKTLETQLLADALLKHETLTAAEVEKILRTKDINSIAKESPPGAPTLLSEPVAASA